MNRPDDPRLPDKGPADAPAGAPEEDAPDHVAGEETDADRAEPGSAGDGDAAAQPGGPRPRPHKRQMPERKKLSVVLGELAADESRQRISVADILVAMEARAFGAMILIFALPNALPAPPGTSAILGLPLVFLSFQLMLGQAPWLPQFIARRSMSRGDFVELIGRAGPVLARAERLLTPRLMVFGLPVAQRVLGAVCLLLSVILLLPIPLGNMLPGLAISLIALGILERDGVWVLIGVATGILSALIVWGVLYAIVRAAIFVFSGAFA